MKLFQYIGPPNRLFRGPVTQEVNPGDLVELPDDWEHFEWIPAPDQKPPPVASPSADTSADSAKEKS